MTLPKDKEKELMDNAINAVALRYTTKKFGIFPVLDKRQLLGDHVRLIIECAMLSERVRKLSELKSTLHTSDEDDDLL